MNACSFARPRCYAAAFDADRDDCLLFTETYVPESDDESGRLYQLGIASRSQLEPSDDTFACPYSSHSTMEMGSGPTFDIFCDTDFGPDAGNLCPDNFAPWECPPHADSLDGCLSHCSRAHPLCRGVTWNHDMAGGFGNCYLKRDPTNYTRTYHSDDYITHSAMVPDDFPSTDFDCMDSAYTSANGKNFAVTCFRGRAGTQNFTSSHQQNIRACMDTCAQSTQGCLGILFDMAMDAGLENCYLLNGTGTVALNDEGNVTFAEMKDAVVSSPSPAVSQPSGPDSEGPAGKRNIAWISSPIVGAVALVCIIAVAMVWYCRRRSARAESAKVDCHGFEPAHSSLPAPSLSPAEKYEGMRIEAGAHEMRDPNSERLYPPELHA